MGKYLRLSLYTGVSFVGYSEVLAMRTWREFLESMEAMTDEQYAAVMDHIRKMGYGHLEGHTKESLAGMGVRSPEDLEMVLSKDMEHGLRKQGMLDFSQASNDREVPQGRPSRLRGRREEPDEYLFHPDWLTKHKRSASE